MGLFGKKDKEPTIRYYTMTTTESADNQSVVEQLKTSLAKSNNDYKLLYAQHQNLTEAYNELLHKKNSSHALEVERDKYKQLYEQEKRKNANLDSVYKELQELRDFKASSKNSQQSYHERIASLQGNHRAEISLLHKQIDELKKRVPDDPSLPTYQELRSMYNKLVRAYNELKGRPVEKEIEERVIYVDSRNDFLERLTVKIRDELLTMTTLYDKLQFEQSREVREKYDKDLIEWVNAYTDNDSRFIACTNLKLREAYVVALMDVHKDVVIKNKYYKRYIFDYINAKYKAIHTLDMRKEGY